MQSTIAFVFVVMCLFSLVLGSNDIVAGESHFGSVVVRFQDSLVVGAPNRLLIRATVNEEVDSAVLVVRMPEGGNSVMKDETVLWEGKALARDTIINAIPLTAFSEGDYRYVVTLKFPNRKTGRLQISSSLFVRVSGKSGRWVEGDQWTFEKMLIKEELESRGLKGVSTDSVLKVFPEIRERYEKLGYSVGKLPGPDPANSAADSTRLAPTRAPDSGITKPQGQIDPASGNCIAQYGVIRCGES